MLQIKNDRKVTHNTWTFFHDTTQIFLHHQLNLKHEIMKLGTIIGDPCRIICRLGCNSETPPGGRHLEF